MTAALRSLLISRGAIVPLAVRRARRPVAPPCLRLDDMGRRAAAVHEAEYREDPDRFVWSRLHFDVDEWMFGVVEEVEV